MPLGERPPLAALPPHGRSFAVVAGDGGVKAEVPALVVVSFYRFADFPDHADFRRPLKELCEELVSAHRCHLWTFITFASIAIGCDLFQYKK
jgi:hypothetical protein